MERIPYGNPGIASFASDAYGQNDLLSGDTPRTTTTENVGASTNLPIFSVVGRTGNAPGGALVLASDTVDPVGITTAPVVTASGVTTTVDVYRSGMFNPAALNWGAYFSTDALKKAAFEGSVSPDIFIQKVQYQDTFT